MLLLVSLLGTFWRVTAPGTLEGLKEVKFGIKLFQVFRAVRLVKSIRFLSKTFATLFYVLPTISPVAALFGLVVYIFALIGNTIFPFIKFQTFVNGWDLSFETFGKSVFSLIRVASGE